MSTRSSPALKLVRDPASVLFICTGNICRSPTAAGVFARYVSDAGLEQRIRVASAGTHGYHVGERADPRTLEAALRRGYDFSEHRARLFAARDFQAFDVLLAMDEGHLAHMANLAQPSQVHKLHLMMAFASRHPGSKSVPDPYYGGGDGFERVLDMLEDAAAGLLAQMGEQLGY